MGASSVPPDGPGHLQSINSNEVLARQRRTNTSNEVKREANCSNCLAARNFTKVCLMPGSLLPACMAPTPRSISSWVGSAINTALLNLELSVNCSGLKKGFGAWRLRCPFQMDQWGLMKGHSSSEPPSSGLFLVLQGSIQHSLPPVEVSTKQAGCK